LPEGVEVVALTKGDNSPIATIVIPRSVLSDEAATEEAEAEAEKKTAG
jgi:large subunit ribosomal protein L25